MEYAIIGILVGAAVGYVGLTLYRRLTGKARCGCGRADDCALKNICPGSRGKGPRQCSR